MNNILKFSAILILFVLMFSQVAFSQSTSSSIISNSTINTNTHISDTQFLSLFKTLFNSISTVVLYVTIILIFGFLIYGIYRLSTAGLGSKNVDMKYYFMFFAGIGLFALVPIILYTFIGLFIPSLISSLTSITVISSAQVTVAEINIIISIAVIFSLFGISLSIYKMINNIPKLIGFENEREFAKNQFMKSFYLMFVSAIIPFIVVALFIFSTTLFVSVSVSSANSISINSAISNSSSTFVVLHKSTFTGCNSTPAIYDIGSQISCSAKNSVDYIGSSLYPYGVSAGLYNFAQQQSHIGMTSVKIVTDFFMLIFGIIFVYSFSVIDYYLLIYMFKTDTEEEGKQFLILKDKIKQYVAFLLSPLLFIFFILFANILITFAQSITITSSINPFPALSLIVSYPTVSNLTLILSGFMSIIFSALLAGIIALFSIVRLLSVIIFPVAIFLYFSTDESIKQIGKKILIAMLIIFIIPMFIISIYSFWFGYIPSLFTSVSSGNIVTGTFFNWNIVSHSANTATITHSNLLSSNHQSYTFSCNSQTQLLNVEQSISTDSVLYGFNSANAYSAVIVACGNYITVDAIGYYLVLMITLLVMIIIILLLIFAPEVLGSSVSSLGSITGLSSVSSLGSTITEMKDMSSSDRLKTLGKSTISTVSGLTKQTGKYVTSSLEGTKQGEVIKTVKNAVSNIGQNISKQKEYKREQEISGYASEDSLKDSGMSEDKKAKVRELMANGKTFEEALKELKDSKVISANSYNKLLKTYRDRDNAYKYLDLKKFGKLTEEQKANEKDKVYKSYMKTMESQDKINNVMKRLNDIDNNSKYSKKQKDLLKRKILDANKNSLVEASENINDFRHKYGYGKENLVDFVDNAEKQKTNITAYANSEDLFKEEGLDLYSETFNSSNTLNKVKSMGYSDIDDFLKNIKNTNQYKIANSIRNFENADSETKSLKEKEMLKVLSDSGVSSSVIDKLKTASPEYRATYFDSLKSISSLSADFNDSPEELKDFINRSFSDQTSLSIAKDIFVKAGKTTGNAIKLYVPNSVEENINKVVSYGNLVSDVFAEALGNVKPIEVSLLDKNVDIGKNIAMYNSQLDNLKKNLADAIKNNRKAEANRINDEMNAIMKRVSDLQNSGEINNSEIELLNKLPVLKTFMNEVSDWNIAGINNKMIEYKERASLVENNSKTLNDLIQKKMSELSDLEKKISVEKSNRNDFEVARLTEQKIKLENDIEKKRNMQNLYDIQFKALKSFLNVDIKGITEKDIENEIEKANDKQEYYGEIKELLKDKIVSDYLNTAKNFNDKKEYAVDSVDEKVKNLENIVLDETTSNMFDYLKENELEALKNNTKDINKFIESLNNKYNKYSKIIDEKYEREINLNNKNSIANLFNQKDENVVVNAFKESFMNDLKNDIPKEILDNSLLELDKYVDLKRGNLNDEQYRNKILSEYKKAKDEIIKTIKIEYENQIKESDKYSKIKGILQNRADAETESNVSSIKKEILDKIINNSKTIVDKKIMNQKIQEALKTNNVDNIMTEKASETELIKKIILAESPEDIDNTYTDIETEYTDYDSLIRELIEAKSKIKTLHKASK
jgi:hypothetical protein